MIKEIKFWKLRICFCLLIWSVGFILCLSNNKLETEYSYLSLYVPVEKTEFVKDDVIEQEIRFNHAEVNCIGFSVVDRTRSCLGNVEVSLLNQDEQCIWQETVDVNAIALKTKKWFVVNQAVSTEAVYKVKITTSDLAGKLYLAVIDVADNIQEVYEQMEMNGTIQDTSLVLGMNYPIKIDLLTKIIILAFCALISVYIIGFEYIFKSKKNVICTVFYSLIVFVPVLWFKHFFRELGTQNLRLYICIMLLYYMAVGIYTWLCLWKKCKKPEIYFLVSFALIGVLYSAILPPFSAPDEGTHFATAYRISNKLMGQAINDENGMIYMRECDRHQYIKFPDNEYVIDTFENLLDPLAESEQMVSSNTSALANAYTLVYLPQAVGITVGRFLHVNSIQLLYMGRLFNMLWFGCLVFIAIKIIPCGKWVIYAISQIPIVMELTTSYSYDTSVLAMALLYIAYVVRLREQKGKLSKKQLIGLCMLGVIFAPMKAIYFFIVGLVFLIANDKISSKNWKAIGYKMVCVLAAIAFVLFAFKGSSSALMAIYYQDSYTGQSTAAAGEMIDGNELVYQDENIYVDDADFYRTGNIEFLVNNPIDFIEDAIETIFEDIDMYVLSLFGNSLGSNEIKMPVLITGSFILLYFLASFKMANGEKMKLGIYERLWVGLIAIAIFGSVFFVFYTQTYPSRTSLWGIQGRYFLPILPLVIFVANVYGEEKENNRLLLVLGSALAHLMIILNVISVIWNR